jgi:hypothetical protein
MFPVTLMQRMCVLLVGSAHKSTPAPIVRYEYVASTIVLCLKWGCKC